MTPEQSLTATALQAWAMNLTRAEKTFAALDDAQLQERVAPDGTAWSICGVI